MRKLVLVMLLLSINLLVSAAEDIKVYEKLCTTGVLQECHRLGLIYQDGKIIDKDIKKAIELYEKSCNSGYSDSCIVLSAIYLFGKGVDKDTNSAIQYLQEACVLGDKSGCRTYKQLTK